MKINYKITILESLTGTVTSQLFCRCVSGDDDGTPPHMGSPLVRQQLDSSPNSSRRRTSGDSNSSRRSRRCASGDPTSTVVEDGVGGVAAVDPDRGVLLLMGSRGDDYKK